MERSADPLAEPALTRRGFLRLSLAAGAATAAGGLVAGCGPAAQPPPGAPAAGTWAAPGAQPAAPAASPSGLDEWVVAFSEDITTVDPLVEGGGSMRWNVSAHVFEPLVGYEGPTFQPTPRLAESWGYLDDLTLEMRLRRGVQFHNGDAFTADDVLYSYQVHRASPALGTGSTFAPVEALEQVDDYTIRWRLKEPTASFLPSMAPVFWVAPRARERIGVEAFGRLPIGTGMYRVEREWTRDQPAYLVANDAYWGGPPAPRRLQFKFLREPSTRVAELQRATIQAAQNVPLPQVDLLKRGANTDVVAAKGARIMFSHINLTRAPFTNVKVRQALNYAINRDLVTRSLLQGYAQPHVGLYAPGFIGHSTDVEPYTYNPAKARQLLAEAGLPNGFEFEWQITDGVFLKDREIAEALAAQLKEAGIVARLRVTERATIYDNIYSGNYDLVSAQWSTTADPDRYLQWLFVRTPGTKDAKEADPFRVMMDEGNRLVDAERRARKYEELGRLAYAQAVILFTHVQDELYGVDKRTGWTPYPVRASASQHYYALHPSLAR